MVPAFDLLILHAFLASYFFGQVYAALTNRTIDDTDTYITLVICRLVACRDPDATSARPDLGLALLAKPVVCYSVIKCRGLIRVGSCYLRPMVPKKSKNIQALGKHLCLYGEVTACPSLGFTIDGNLRVLRRTAESVRLPPWSAVYIYGIDIANPANITFGMSSPPLTSFHYYGGDGYVYNSLFFLATGLDPTVQHPVTWILSQSISSGVGEAGLLDYALVTVDQAYPSSSSPMGSSTLSLPFVSFTAQPPHKFLTMAYDYRGSSIRSPETTGSSAIHATMLKSKTGAIIGIVLGVVGALVFLAIGTAFIFRCRRTITRRVGETSYAVEPYQLHAGAPITPTYKPSPNGDSLALTLNSKPPLVPVVMTRDLHHLDAARARDLEERLQNLEELVASRPPGYS
ncbi:hypothetical protein K438DRAFT_1760039 [Mycena galopus ATCC 62051]|nr:hypothetical protein K438DRAFT_1760039 [Mycena galopus ATCC 62051]